MAEGWARHLLKGQVEAYSAGVEPHGVDPRAVRVMAEAGVNISNQSSKHLNALNDLEFDLVITLCDEAYQACPIFPGQKRVTHMGFDDPPRLAVDARDEDEAMAHYRRVRDEIQIFVKRLPELLAGFDR